MKHSVLVMFCTAVLTSSASAERVPGKRSMTACAAERYGLEAPPAVAAHAAHALSRRAAQVQVSEVA